MAITPYREWLRGRTPSQTLLRQWQQEMKIHSSPFGPRGSESPGPTSPSGSSGTRGTRMPPEPSAPSSGTRDSRAIPERRTGTSRPSGGDPFADIRSGSSGSSGRGGDPFAEIRDMPTETRPSPPSGTRPSPPSGTRPSPGGPIPDTPPPAPAPSPSGPPTRRFVPGSGSTADPIPPSGAASKGASAASKASGWSKAGKAVGKVLNSPGGKLARWAGKKILIPLAGAKLAGDTWGAFEPGIDTLRYGHQLPYKDGVGGRDNRVNDLLGNVSPLEAIKEGMTQDVLSKATGGTSDKVLKFMFPYRERPRPAAAPAATGSTTTKPQRPATPTRPSAPAPQQPGSIPEMGRQGRAQSKALRSPDDYLGSAFDATLRKGIDTGRNYLQSQMNKDGLDSEDQSRIMSRFNDKIAGDKLLSAKGNEQGLVGAINRNDASRTDKTAGRGERTLEAYRQKSPMGTYGKGAKAEEIQRKFVKQ